MKDNLIKVDGHPGYYRDMVTGAIVNKNTSALDAAKKKKAALNRDRERMEELEQKVDNLTGMLETLLAKLS